MQHLGPTFIRVGPGGHLQIAGDPACPVQVWLGHAHWHLSGGGKGPAAACQIMQRAIKVRGPAAAPAALLGLPACWVSLLVHAWEMCGVKAGGLMGPAGMAWLLRAWEMCGVGAGRLMADGAGLQACMPLRCMADGRRHP